MDAMRLVKDVLFVAGPQWGDRSPDDIIKALDLAGYVIVPREQLETAASYLMSSEYASAADAGEKLLRLVASARPAAGQ
jgi:hypothetical protein